MLRGGDSADADLSFSMVGHCPGDGMMIEGKRLLTSFLPTLLFTDWESLIGTSSDSLSVISYISSKLSELRLLHIEL